MFSFVLCWYYSGHVGQSKVNAMVLSYWMSILNRCESLLAGTQERFFIQLTTMEGHPRFERLYSEDSVTVERASSFTCCWWRGLQDKFVKRRCLPAACLLPPLRAAPEFCLRKGSINNSAHWSGPLQWRWSRFWLSCGRSSLIVFPLLR